MYEQGIKFYNLLNRKTRFYSVIFKSLRKALLLGIKGTNLCLMKKLYKDYKDLQLCKGYLQRILNIQLLENIESAKATMISIKAQYILCKLR